MTSPPASSPLTVSPAIRSEDSRGGAVVDSTAGAMRRRGGAGSASEDDDGGNGGSLVGRRRRERSFLTRCVDAAFAFVKLAEFEILFFLFFFTAFLIFKDLTSRPGYNQILVKKPGDDDYWPFSNYKRE